MSGEGLLTGRRRPTRLLATFGASAAVALAGASLLAGHANHGVSLLEGPPVALSSANRVGDGSTDRAQLIAMAERDVASLVRRIIAEQHREVQPVQKRIRTFGKRGLRVAQAPQLAATLGSSAPEIDDLVVGGRHFVRSQMLSAIDDFFESDDNKVNFYS